MKQKLGLISSIAVLILICNACASPSVGVDNHSQSPDITKNVYIDDRGYCKDVVFETSEKKLSFNAKVRIPKELDSIFYYTMSVSESHFGHLAENEIIEKFEEYTYNTTGKSIEYFASGATGTYSILNIDEEGHLYYDTSGGLSGTLIGELYEYNSFVDPSEYDIAIGMDEAIEMATSFAKRYSNLDFFCYRSLIEYDSKEESGCYRVYLQAQIDGIPICELSDNPMNSFMVRFNIDSSGVTYFQGKICFDNIAKGDLSIVISFDEIMEIFQNNFSIFMYKNRGTVYDISLEYYAANNADGTYYLRPIWCFHIQYEGSYDTISFFADTGEFCHSGVA